MVGLKAIVVAFIIFGVVGFVLHLVAAQIARFAGEFIRVFATSVSMFLCIAAGSMLTLFGFMSPLGDDMRLSLIILLAALFVLTLIPFATLLMTKQRPMVGEEFAKK